MTLRKRDLRDEPKIHQAIYAKGLHAAHLRNAGYPGTYAEGYLHGVLSLASSISKVIDDDALFAALNLNPNYDLETDHRIKP